MGETTYYAIGDVHGMAGKLARLHDAIVGEVVASGRPAAVVHLGDYVDRGPESRRVIDLVMTLETRLPPSARSHALLGNHERMMLDAYEEHGRDAERQWLFNGGETTIASYGAAAGDREWRERIDTRHIVWLRSLPTIVRDDKLVFVHAGIEPRLFPACDDEVHLWTRSERFFETARWPDRPELDGVCVVHGHTPTDDERPYADARRINVDTGAVFGGPLTCAVIAPGERVRFLYA